MMAVATFTKSGSKATTPAKLDKKIFGVEIKDHSLLKLAYSAYLAEGRRAKAKTKTRGEVRGGGAKPRPQKGTGRARFGSTRNPVWIGGGVAFGPTGNENYSLQVSTRSKHAALRQALTLAAQAEKLIVIDDIALTSAKTKDAVKLLARIGAAGRVLIVLDDLSDQNRKALNNLANVKLVRANYLTVFDILNADKVVLNKAALEHIGNWLSAKAAVRSKNV
jgi:large subunit ribosomal protein L4